MRDPGLGPIALMIIGVVVLAAGVAGATGIAFSAAACDPGPPFESFWLGNVTEGGSAVPGADVTLYLDEAVVGEGASRTDGSYAIHVMSTRTDTVYQIVARAPDLTPATELVRTPCLVPSPPLSLWTDLALERVPGLDAGFTFTTSGLEVRVVDASTGGPDSWSWSWGDGASTDTTEPAASHLFAAAGTYTVTLTASRSSDGAQDTASSPVMVSAGRSGSGDTDTGATDDFTSGLPHVIEDRTLFWGVGLLGLVLVAVGAWWYREASGS